MVALRLLKTDYTETSDCEESSDGEESMVMAPIEPELPEQEYLDFADKAMEKVGDDPAAIAKQYDINIPNLLGGTLREATREEIRNRLAGVFKLRDTEPWEEAGFGD